MTPLYAVIDTNVIVSSLITKNVSSPTVQVLAEVFSGRIVPLYSSEILTEYRAVLVRKRFGLSPDQITETLDAFIENGVFIDPNAVSVKLPDPKDLPFYEVVMDTRDEGSFLVTGNLKHFPHEPFIVTPRELLEILDG